MDAQHGQRAFFGDRFDVVEVENEFGVFIFSGGEAQIVGRQVDDAAVGAIASPQLAGARHDERLFAQVEDGAEDAVFVDNH